MFLEFKKIKFSKKYYTNLNCLEFFRSFIENRNSFQKIEIIFPQ